MASITVNWMNRSWDYICNGPKKDDAPTIKGHQDFVNERNTSFAKRATPAQTFSLGGAIVFALGWLFSLKSDNGFAKWTTGILAGVGAAATAIFGLAKGWNVEAKKTDSVQKDDAKQNKPFDPTSKESFFDELNLLSADLHLVVFSLDQDDTEKLKALVSKYDQAKVQKWVTEVLTLERLSSFTLIDDSIVIDSLFVLATIQDSDFKATDKLIKYLDFEKLHYQYLPNVCDALVMRYNHVDSDEMITSRFKEIINDKSITSSSTIEEISKKAAVVMKGLGINNDSVEAAILERLEDLTEDLSFRASIASNLMNTNIATKPSIAKILYRLLESKDTEPKIRKAIVIELGQGYPHDKEILLRFADIVKNIEQTEEPVVDEFGRSVASENIRAWALKQDKRK